MLEFPVLFLTGLPRYVYFLSFPLLAILYYIYILGSKVCDDKMNDNAI